MPLLLCALALGCTKSESEPMVEPTPAIGAVSEQVEEGIKEDQETPSDREEQDSDIHVDMLSDEGMRQLRERLATLDKSLPEGNVLLPVNDFPVDFGDKVLPKLKAVLPPGWSITQTQRNSAPDDWHTFDKTGFMVEGRKEDEVFRTWFLQRNWVGVRQPDKKRLRMTYWEGILVGKEYKTITNCDDVKLQESFRKLGLQTPSLINSGWWSAQKIFEGKFDEADQKSRQLIRHFCKNEEERNEAARSLIILGIPAKYAFLRCALNGKGEAREFCASTLTYFGGKDAVRALCWVLNDPQGDAACQKAAAMSLEKIGDPDAGSALLKALDHITWVEARTHVVEALGRIRYKPAAPKILELMEQEKNEYYRKAYYPSALASLRYSEAIPAIKKLCKVKQFKNSKDLDFHRNCLTSAEMALLRLTGTWGEPADGIRLLILPPENPVAGKPVVVSIAIENVADKHIDIIVGPSGRFVVNGQKQEMGGSVYIDDNRLPVNRVFTRSYNLSHIISKPGVYEVQYEILNAKSNIVRFKVSPVSNK